jgi:hypothetical protein
MLRTQACVGYIDQFRDNLEEVVASDDDLPKNIGIVISRRVKADFLRVH